MKDWLIVHSGAGGLLRRYTVLSALVATGILIAANGVITVIQQVIPDRPTRLSAYQASRDAPRLYTVTRSVLDDQITTGSIQKVDPCGKNNASH